MGSTNIGNVSITWFGNAGFMIKGDGRVIHIDPCILPESVPDADMADILLITCEHPEHCCPDSIRKVRKPDSTTLIPENLSLQFRGDARRIIGGDELIGDLGIKGVDIRVVPAVNKNSSDTPDGHGVGYLIELDSLSIYHAGCASTIPVADIGDAPVDIALLPIAGVSGIGEAAAAEAAVLLSAKVLIPMNYTEENGNTEEVKKLVKAANPDIDVIVL